jgi:hypothetical protein
VDHSFTPLFSVSEGAKKRLGFLNGRPVQGIPVSGLAAAAF